MTTELVEPNATAARDADAPASAATNRIRGFVCRNCGRPEAFGLAYVCSACFGPLEIDYDLASISIDRATIAARGPAIWRYLELLPVDAPPARGLVVGSSPLLQADRLADRLGVDRLLLKDDTRNPTLSFKDRAVAVAAANAPRLGITTLACASTGNLAAATAATAAAIGLPSFVFVPSTVEPGKIRHALAYGATVVPIDGTYDDVNRLCIEVADELGWGFVNVNLRPYYAEGSKTLAFEIAEQLGWRTPDVIVAPIASGALFTKLAKGFRELAAVGLIEERPVRFVGAQAAGCSPVARAWASGGEVEPIRTPDTFVHSLAIGSPADGRYVIEVLDSNEGSVEAVSDDETAQAIRDTARLEGVFVEPAGGVTVAAVSAARRRGVIRDGDEVVALVTGNGLKTPDAFEHGLDVAPATGNRPGLAPVLPPNFSSFERWLQA
ncbi:MAG TPA: threonine synthase [Candidatus Limnocylindria bacterium]|nr:threonine synthase [Candidatus Limnocylindria bacterium]